MARPLNVIAALLWLSAETMILIAVGSSAWPVVAGWTVGGIAVVALALAAHHLGWSRPVRAGAAEAIVVACVVLTWEGGLFFLPAALTLLVATLDDETMRPSTHLRLSPSGGDRGSAASP